MLNERPSKILLALALSLLVLGSAPAPLSLAASASKENSLVLSTFPQNLPTEQSGVSAFSALVVSLVNAKGDPTIALNDTVVYLSSSETAVLTVQSSVTILAGTQYAIAEVTTTETPGSITVSAVSPGVESGSTQFSTYVARGYPAQLSIYLLPSELPSGSASNATLLVAVDDAAGLPARTVDALSVQITSSNTSVASIGNNGVAKIAANQTIGYASVETTGDNGSVSITASATGLVSATTALSVLPSNGLSPVGLKLTAPTDLPADGGTYRVLTVSLLSNGSYPAVAKTTVPIFLTSSRPDLVSILSPNPTILPGQSFTTVAVQTAAASGFSFITASALNFTSATTQVSTDSIPPTKLGIYLSEAHSLVSAKANSLELAVQLQDSGGLPAEARSAAQVIISFSNSTLNKPLLTLEIPKGKDLVYATLPLVGSTAGTFTAISNGLDSASIGYSASDSPVTVNLGAASSTIRMNETTVVYFSVLYQGMALPGAKVVWTVTGGTVSPHNSTTDSRGAASTLFTPSSPGIVTLTVTVTNSAIGTVNSSIPIIIITVPPKAPPPSLLSRIFSYIYYIIAAVAVVVVLVVVVVRRRRGRSKEGDEGFDIGGGPGAAFDLRGQ